MLEHFTLTTADFDVKSNSVYVNTGVTNKTPGMLLIWAEWCGHCQRFKPTFERLQQRFGKNFPLLSIEDSELSRDDSVKRSLNFRGYPTMKFFDQHGKIIGDYTGDRDEESVLKHVCNVFHHCISYH